MNHPPQVPPNISVTDPPQIAAGDRSDGSPARGICIDLTFFIGKSPAMPGEVAD
jgi:hypothetical protein